MEEGTASSATSKLSLSALGVFWEGLRQTGKPRLAAAAVEPSQGPGVLGLVLEGKTKVQGLKCQMEGFEPRSAHAHISKLD